MVGSVVAASGGFTQTVTADGRSLVATVTVPDSLDVRTFLDRLERRYPDIELLARRERESASMTRESFLQRLESSLTERRSRCSGRPTTRVLPVPRDATGQDVADALGVSQPTISHHLRAGQGTLFAAVRRGVTVLTGGANRAAWCEADTRVPWNRFTGLSTIIRAYRLAITCIEGNAILACPQ